MDSAESTPTLASTPTFAPVALPTGLQLTPFAALGTRITDLTHAGDGSGRLFVVEQAGRIRIVQDSAVLETPFLDISDRVDAGGNEQGLLSLAFAPDFAAGGAFYVNYTARPDGATVVSRFRVSAEPSRADPASEQRLLVIDQPAGNHNGGQLRFGPDGYLYIGTGDGGRAGDPWDNAQDTGVLLGKLLRLDVRGDGAYAVPDDNPFVGQRGAAPEIWAVGLRNPWRFSFDRLTGDLYIGDVGQSAVEEINFVAAGSGGGLDFGWNTLEGNDCFEPRTGCRRAGTTPPIFTYSHDDGCSVTGGYVYRGARYPALSGTYLLADYCSGTVWGLLRDADGAWQAARLLETGYSIAAFGEDADGELYVLDLGGTILRVESAESLP